MTAAVPFASRRARGHFTALSSTLLALLVTACSGGTGDSRPGTASSPASAPASGSTAAHVPAVARRLAMGLTPETVGNGGDYSAQVSGTISRARGSFTGVTGLNTEVDAVLNRYSLQLNTNTFDTSACNGAAAGCQGWQQFIYQSSGAIYMQYWLIGYNSTDANGNLTPGCPTGWATSGNSCFHDSAHNNNVPAEPVTNLANMTMTATTNAFGESMTVTTGDGNTYSLSAPGYFFLQTVNWNAAEFNVFGDAGGTNAFFNLGATVGVQLLTDSLVPTTAAPGCVAEGFTGETTNFNLTGSCTAFGGSSPGIQFTESTNSPGLASASRPINAISRGPGSIDIFYRNLDGTVHTNDLSSQGWGGDNSIAGPGVGNPLAVPRGSGRIDAFSIGYSGEIDTADWAGGATWSTWHELVPGSFSGGLVGLSRDDGQLIDMFGSSHGSLNRDAWDGSNWSSSVLQQSSLIVGVPAIVSWGPERMDVFVQGTDNGLYTKSWDGTTWYDYFPIHSGVQFSGNPTAVSRASNVIDVFVRGTDGKLYTTSWDNGPAWTNYSLVNDMQFVGDPYAVASGPNRIDVFVRGTDGKIYTKTENGTTWDTNYTGLGGAL